jgi:hypothetical protein
VAAGPEGSARVDDDGLALGGRCLPWRPHPEAADLHRAVELAPAVLPAARHRDRGHLSEGSPESFFPGVVRICHEL